MNTLRDLPPRFVVVAFSTSGDSVQKGDRITELFAQEWIDDAPTHRIIRFKKATHQRPFHAAISALQGLIGPDPAVIHDLYDWKRFLRVELKGMNAAEVIKSFDRAVDVSAWSQMTYPRQRRDLNSLARRLGISELPSGELECEAHVLGHCAVAILSCIVAGSSTAVPEPSNHVPLADGAKLESERSAQPQSWLPMIRRMAERLLRRLAWSR